jgi:sugar (pentulose or hexulose) kinase
MRILSLDVGTSSVKAAVLDVASSTPEGAVARVAYSLNHPTPEAAEVSPDRLWSSVTEAARQAARGWEGIAGVGLSCLTPGLVLLDAADRALGPIWTHLDRRARPTARHVWADVGPEFLATTGNRPLPGGITAVSWRQQLEQDPYVSRRVRQYLHVNGWLGLVLTGVRAFDRANACFSGLYGTLTDRQWSERWCSYFEVNPAWLPPVVCGSTTLGALRSQAAAELGVPPGIPVKLGTADTSSAMLAAGIGPSDLLHVVGTTQVLAAFASRPRPDPHRLTRQLGVGEAYIHVTHNPVGGAALDWLRELCFRDQSEADFYARWVPLARERPTRVSLDPPFLGGDRLEIEAHRAAFRDLTLACDRLDLLAAVLQAMIRGHRRALADLGVESRFERVFLTGGGADVVRQLIPEYGSENVQPLEEGSLRGVARLFS